MKTRGPLFTPNLRASLCNYVLVTLGALLLCSCIPWVDKYIYGDYSIKPLKYDKQYRKLLESITNTSEEKTEFKNITEKGRELQEARKECEMRKAELTEAEKRLTDRENELKKAKEELVKTEDALNRATTDEKVRQNQLLGQVKAALLKAEDEYKKASDKRKELEGAVSAAEVRVGKLQEEFNKLKTVASEERSETGGRKPPRNGFVDKKCWDGSELSDKEKTNCKYQRNLLIGDLMGISDGMCENHMKTILGNEATMNIITGTFTNAFSGAATVVSETLAKSILAALAFFSNSERSLINETVYKSVLVPAIIKKINEIRLNERNTLIKKYEDNKNADYEDYPVSFAISDVIKYHQSCSFMVGLQKALEEGTQPAPGQDRASLEQKLKTLVHEKDNRIRELRAMKAGISDEEINMDKYVIYLNGEIDAITRKISEPGAKGSGHAEITALREAKVKLKDATAVVGGVSVVVSQVKLDEAKKQLFFDLSLKKEGKDISEEDAKIITEKDIKQALLKLKEAYGLKEGNIVIEKCQPPVQK